jgi:transposase-like protein
MQYELRSDGKRIFPSQLKRQILDEVEAGGSPSQVARCHGVPVHYVIRWRGKERQNHEKALVKAGATPGQPEPAIPLSEYRRLAEENKNLKRSLADMTMDRDILKDAVAIASKKKWL